MKAQLNELASLRSSDFWGPNAPKYVGGAIAGALWLYYTEGNMLYAGLGYFLYKRLVDPPRAAQAPPGAAAAGVAAAGGAAAAAVPAASSSTSSVRRRR